MIKALIFDYNGVLTNHGDFESFLAEKAKNTSRDAREIQQIVRQYWDLAKVGAIDSELIWVHVAGYFHCEAQELRREWLSWFKLRQDLLLLITKLKNKYKTALLTNITRDWFEQVRKEQNLEAYFEVIVSSYEAKAAKPDPEIFEYTLQKLGLKADECIFIDDQEKNTSAAFKIGFKVILFESVKKLKVQLMEYGVMV